MAKISDKSVEDGDKKASKSKKNPKSIVFTKKKKQGNPETGEKNATKSKKNPKIKVFSNKKKQGTPETVLIQKLQAQYEIINTDNITKFSDFPLSPKTLKALRECGYHKPTDIQKQSIGLSLQGKDILGAAQTGSGKTLAFLIPILEKLFCKQWTRLDGLGALVITPTRELAYQIFETLRRVGVHHDFSAGLIIGGKDLKFERNRMDQCNIIICTPGRLLQHMDENPLFDCVNMHILVLDEADRCLDMGFAPTMNAIIANLPLQRQTLLFSATQTKSVKDLARLSLKDPSYVSVHEMTTPKELKQTYVVCELQDKVSILWSFIRNHLKHKIIIFLSSCKQVKYLYEVFCKLRPGTSLMALYGTLHQLRRMEIYETFVKKQSAVLFATDLAARGLDFPAVHWVVQADCPEDAATYIHRVGRTARYHRNGESLLLLLESELKIVEDLKEKKIPIDKIEINPAKLNNPVRKMEAFLAKDPALKDTAQRAFVSYAKAIFLMKDKDIFDVQSLDTDSYAKSLGLAIPPRIRFLQRLQNKTSNTSNKHLNKNASSENKKIYFNENDKETTTSTEKNTPLQTKIKKEARNASDDSGVSADEQNGCISNMDKLKPSGANFNASDSEEDDILMVKRKDHDIELPSTEEMAALSLGKNKKKPITKAALAKKLLKKKIIPNKKTVFNDEGNAVIQGTKERKSELAQEYENEDASGIDIEKARLVLREEDKFDKQMFKEKVKAKHKEEKRKLKEKKKRSKDDEDKEDDGEIDDFGGTSDDEVEPDLSWLPDPDQIYGEKESDLEEFYNEQQAEKSKEKKEKKTSKRQRTTDDVENKDESITNNSNNTKKKKSNKVEKIAANLDVNEAEELAMMLLKNK